MKKILDTNKLALAKLVCPAEYNEFKDVFISLIKAKGEYDAIESGRWTLVDIENSVTSRTQDLSHDELVKAYLEDLAEEVQKLATVGVAKLNKMNRIYLERTKDYIMDFFENRDLRLKDELIESATLVG